MLDLGGRFCEAREGFIDGVATCCSQAAALSLTAEGVDGTPLVALPAEDLPRTTDCLLLKLSGGARDRALGTKGVLLLGGEDVLGLGCC